MATQLVTHERIRTTWHKAMALRRIAEKLITYSKKARGKILKGDQIYYQRRIEGILTTQDSRNKVITDLHDRFMYFYIFILFIYKNII